ncbi:hypothetical protein EYZ11_011995 [Aspergillus tanneri]|uniref:Transcription factor TFIIIC triple barrel domain-containing protein n=1 Tax=Aspergillus tanneri TaxID=1220188 RepID=A0A4S3J1N3_9EURO|nr:uncharacterized protein ATNIH1004_002675 [Aspergillus tanneri]KAA8649995.1 hypothetical protein ATNIH1004_002675 [Aspergillus tanneri]THC88555.1 hypothetical protein EYZ11_011995 [Aspergillus tanneri]
MQSHSDPILVLDPAMLSDPAYLDEDHSDYEYEYHDHETESFYLNLDLTSHHGPNRPPRRRPDPPQTTISSATTPPEALSGNTPRDDETEPTLASTEFGNSLAERVQILGLHTRNPIVSYRNQIYSCSWADQIGTELVFSQPELDPEPDSVAQTSPLMRRKDFELIAANSVKILGRKANLISSTSLVGPAQDPLYSDPAVQGSDPATGMNRRSVPLTSHARFIDQLKSVKQAKGEIDTVRGSFSLKRSQNLEDRLRGWARTDEQLAEIQRLNNAAIQGNPTAMAELEKLYVQIRNQETGPSEKASQDR